MHIQIFTSNLSPLLGLLESGLRDSPHHYLFSFGDIPSPHVISYQNLNQISSSFLPKSGVLQICALQNSALCATKK